MTRAIAFNVMRFGNSDPKKAPKNPERFWRFPWDKVTGTNAEIILKQHAEMKRRREQLQMNAAGGKS